MTTLKTLKQVLLCASLSMLLGMQAVHATGSSGVYSKQGFKRYCPDLSVCPAGPQGPKGDTGPQGAAGKSLTREVILNTCRINDSSVPTLISTARIECQAACPTGKIVVSGGCSLNTPSKSMSENSGYALSGSHPLSDAGVDAWRCEASLVDDATAKSGLDNTLNSYAICTDAPAGTSQNGGTVDNGGTTPPPTAN